MRFNQLTFTRFLAAISIVVFHYGKNVFPFNHATLDFMFRQANIGVSYFFILSGFVMVIAYGAKDRVEFWDYIKRRLARIYPVYLLAILILLVYFIVSHKTIDYLGLILNAMLIQSWVPGYALSFNGPGWSLTVEMFFYFSFPFLYNYFFKKYGQFKKILLVFVVFLASQIAFHTLRYSSFYKGFSTPSHEFIFYFPLMHLNEFLIGCLTGMALLKGALKPRNYDLKIFGLILLIPIMLKWNLGINYHNGMLAFVFAPLILLISFNTGVLTRIMNNKICVFLGEISYGMYILQMPVYIWVSGVMKYLNVNNPILFFYTGLIILISLSAISFKYIETPLRRTINKM